MSAGGALSNNIGSGDVPAVELLGADRGAYPDAVAETDAGAVTITDARTDARTDDGDARAHTTTVGEPDARALVTTNHSRALKQADASAMLV